MVYAAISNREVAGLIPDDYGHMRLSSLSQTPDFSFILWWQSNIQPCKLLNGAIPAQVAKGVRLLLQHRYHRLWRWCQKVKTCVCACVCVCVCVCQLVRLVGTRMPDSVGSVANGLGCLKV